jgi:hypothetical protein
MAQLVQAAAWHEVMHLFGFKFSKIVRDAIRFCVKPREASPHQGCV